MARVYVVTGSASGIGAATVKLLHGLGHRTIGVDLRDADVTANLSRPEGRRQAAREVMDLAGGTIDAVVACAGIAQPVSVTVSVNYFGVTELLDLLLPALERSPAPRVAVASSLASLGPVSPELVEACLSGDESRALAVADQVVTGGPEAGMLTYLSSKRALSRWVRRECVASTWAGRGIALNAVAPGTVVTPMMSRMLATPETVAAVDAAAPMPLNYHQQPEAVAHLLIWLTSEENTHVTGQTVYIDGGADASLRGDDIWSWADAQQPPTGP
ncbi:SDR family oxidoreductase [Streptomyces sp. NPDC050433]|uniref:SDR family oxidoreductase n=1 Tax=Streptomyces sp. NPDC050433 TaxID=3365615 RepID=UPI0037A014C3